ncbi:uncharacterized protein LOC141623303 [Silene latifolia]|uniref:uncharacterized protein LOC141623303 n=1 Tax=Silene latifolia TaxID=37657 RepID=UPI003D787DCD
MEGGAGWTVISDQQKGLIGAIESLWPEAEHRNCARHIYSNWSKNHKGKVLEKQFWKCVKATSKGDYECELAQLKGISKQAYDDFIRRSPEHFCKSFFKTHSCCDVVDNNMAETFNSFILLSRYKPIVSMLEDIRMALMERNRKNLELVKRFVDGVAPRISQKLEESYEQQQNCECKWNGEDTQSGFEVIHNGVSHAVNIDQKTCSCRSWDLTGIPCCHGMSALLYMRIQPETTLPKWYTLQTYKQTYSNFLKPVPGNTFWVREGEGMVLPPDIVKSKLGGTRRKARRRDPDEVPKNKSKYCRKGLPTKCGNCGEQGHDKRKCPLPKDLSHVQHVESSRSNQNNLTRDVAARVWNRGRKKGGKNRLGRTLDDVPTPSEYVKKIRGHKDTTTATTGAEEGSTSLTWLEASSARRGRARARGRGSGGMSRGRFITPQGVGVYFGDEGEMIYKASTTTPGIIINAPAMLSQMNFSNQSAASSFSQQQ